MKEIAKALRLYVITDRSFLQGKTVEEMVTEALSGGVTMVQLREKDLSEEEFLKEAMRVKVICRKFHVPLIINDSISVAIKSGADGVHLGQSDLPEDLRELKKRNLIVGITAKTIKQAKMAEAMGADYLGVGALFGSQTKQDARSITLDECRAVCESVSIPAVGIGGVNEKNIEKLKGLPLQGVAVISALFGKEDVKGAAEKLRNLVSQYLCEEK